MVATLAQRHAIDTRDLERKLRHLQRSRSLLAFALVAPLLLFVAINFLVPVGLILFKSIDDREVSAILPRVTSAIANWKSEGLPDESVLRLSWQRVQSMSLVPAIAS